MIAGRKRGVACFRAAVGMLTGIAAHGCAESDQRVSDDASIQLQAIIDRMRQGDQAARRELLDRACLRLRKLAAKMLSGSFPMLTPRHEVDSIVHETWLRLVQTIEKTDPPTVADFFRLAAFKIRQVLLDLADKQRRLGRREMQPRDATTTEQPLEPGNQTLDPSRLALWTEFHERVQTLEETERTVFEMHYYLEMPQAEIARMLDLHPRKVSYLWVAATEKLAEQLDGMERMP